jgi:hypothetical protein
MISLLFDQEILMALGNKIADVVKQLMEWKYYRHYCLVLEWDRQDQFEFFHLLVVILVLII